MSNGLEITGPILRFCGTLRCGGLFVSFALAFDPDSIVKILLPILQISGSAVRDDCLSGSIVVVHLNAPIAEIAVNGEVFVVLVGTLVLSVGLVEQILEIFLV